MGLGLRGGGLLSVAEPKINPHGLGSNVLEPLEAVTAVLVVKVHC
jgi:hypothetical protein